MTKNQCKIEDFFDLLKAYKVEIPENFRKFLGNSRFFICPASISHHNSGDGGLLDHSICVAETLLLLSKRNCLNWERPASPVIVGLFHDLCKVETYEEDSDGWAYANRDQQLYTGHGDKSVLMLTPYLSLTAEEVACIRWHMGAFDEKENWNHYTAAVRAFPNVLWTHTADMIAAHILQR